MINTRRKMCIPLLCLTGMIFAACNLRPKLYESPPGYNLQKPQKFLMKDALSEISGIAFNNGNPSIMYAVQDEEGKLFYFNLAEKKPPRVKFGKNGDYEDVAICNNYAVILKSDGTLYTFPLNDIVTEEINTAKEIKDLLPPGEYEALCSTDSSHQLAVLCKDCKDDKTGKSITGYKLQLQYGNIVLSSSFHVNVEEIKVLTGENKMQFHPSGITQNPLTKEWYIISSVNKLLVVADANWKIKAAYHLKPSKFLQPEGICFDTDGNLYISNEGGELESGNVLEIRFHKK